MTTQRDWLAAALALVTDAEPDIYDQMADFLLACGVRVVGEDEVVIKRTTWDAIVAAVDDSLPG